MHAAIMRSNEQNCRDRGHDGMFAHSSPEEEGRDELIFHQVPLS